MFLNSIRERIEIRLERYRQLRKISRIRYETQGLPEHIRKDINLEGYIAELRQEAAANTAKRSVYIERVHKKRASP